MFGKDTVYDFDAKSGTLSLRMSGYRARIRWLPKPIAEEDAANGSWKVCWPENRLVLPVGSEFRDQPTNPQSHVETHSLAEFRQLIPENIAAFVEPFPSRQWALLALLHDVPDVLAWGVDNPVLAYCVANNAEFRNIGEQAAALEARYHCMQKQKTILKWLKFPATPAIVKLLKKVIPEAAEPWMLRTLRAAVATDKHVMEMLSHHTRITFGMIALLAHRKIRTLVTRDLLTEVAARSEDMTNSPTADLLASALNKMLLLPRQPLPSLFYSCKAIKDFHDEIDAAFEAHTQKQEILAKRLKAFPVPPIPGTDTIVPITSSADLKVEGRAMGHCIATYAARIKKGIAYAYRVLAPERATLLLTRGAAGRWYRSEFRLRFNERPGMKTTVLVTEWLSMNQKERVQ